MGAKPAYVSRGSEYWGDVRLRELEAVAEALDSCHATLTLGSRDWSMSKDTAWLYGVLVGWEDAEEDPEGGALAEIVARYAMPPEAVARMRRLHAAVASLHRMAGR